jgi:hypothetical protein
MNAPKQLLSGHEERMGPAVTFGFGMLDDGTTEVETHFARPSVLHDVRLKPLGCVLRNWWHRTERDRPKPAGTLNWCQREGLLRKAQRAKAAIPKLVLSMSDFEV